MYVCMYVVFFFGQVCVCVCMYVCVCVCVYKYVCVYVFMYACVYKCIQMHTYVYICMHVLKIHMYACTENTYMQAYAPMWIYTLIHIHTYHCHLGRRVL